MKFKIRKIVSLTLFFFLLYNKSKAKMKGVLSLQLSQLKLNEKILKIVITCIAIICVSATIIMASETDTDCITPSENSYFELKTVKVTDIEGKNKQVIMELWGNNIEFKRI